MNLHDDRGRDQQIQWAGSGRHRRGLVIILNCDSFGVSSLTRRETEKQWSVMNIEFIPFIVKSNNDFATDIEEQLSSELLRLFFSTYAFSYDRPSRRAIQRCIRTIFIKSQDPVALSTFVDAMQNEATKVGIAPSSAFVLVEWFGILLQECSGTDNWARWGVEIILSDAQVLELSQSVSSKLSMRNSALAVTRRALRKVFSRQETREGSINDIVSKLTDNGAKSASRNAVMLGVIAGVCSRQTELKTILESRKANIYAFYAREILGSRSPVPVHIANGLHEFFINFATNEDVEKQLIPSLEKGFLRAPEIVLDDLITPLFLSLPDTIDLSDAYSSKLQKPLLSNIKSSIAAIRHGTIATFKAIISHCQKEESLIRISEEILSPLKSGKLSAADQRALHSEMLAAIPVSERLTDKILLSAAIVAAKETSEVALSMETLVLVSHVTWRIRRGVNVDKLVMGTFVKGISDKKVPIRRLWTLRLGEVFWASKTYDLEKPSLISLAETVSPALVELWNEIISNPLSAAQSGLVTAAFVLTALVPTKLWLVHSGKVEAGLRKAQILQQAMTFDPKPSFLLNYRIYTKLTNDDDVIWLVRALSAVSGKFDSIDPESAVAIAWAQAVIFCICSNSSTPYVRRQAIDSLSHAYVQRPTQIASIIMNGLWRCIQPNEAGDKDGAVAVLKIYSTQLYQVVKAICLPPVEASRLGAEVSVSSREQQMISMLVISRPELLPRVHWIDLCLRVGVDPGDLARKYTEDLIEQVLSITNFDETVSLSVIFFTKISNDP